jgi:hypothetical protein
MTNRFKALLAGLLIVATAGGECYADVIHLTCKSRIVSDPSLSLLVNLDYAAKTVEVATLSDLKPLPDRHGKFTRPVRVTDTQVSWRRDVDAGQVQKLLYTLSRAKGGLSVVPAEADGAVIKGAPRGSYRCVPGPMPKPAKPKTTF